MINEPAVIGDPASTDFVRFRTGFPGATSRTYLDVADRGLISAKTKVELASYLDACAQGDTHELANRWIDLARQRFARLINADENEIALVKNVSDGINAVATAIDWQQGDNVVLCPKLEHPSNLHPWQNLRDRCGIVLREVEPTNWSIDTERMVSAIDARTKIVATSMVTFAPGFRADLAGIGNACRASGALFLVDAAQAVGVLDVDVSKTPIDALAVGTPKALLGLYGMGFLFIRQNIANELRPVYLSGQGVNRGAPYDAGRIALKSGARRFEVGNPNHLGCVAAATSIDQLQALGPAGIEQHALVLARTLSEGLKALGLPVIEPLSDGQRTNIVAIGPSLEDSIDATSNSTLQSLCRYLTNRHVRLSIRRGVLRFSTHAYNCEDDIARTLELTREWRRFASE